MDNKELELFEKLKAQKEKQLKRQNKYMMEKYDRIALLLPKGSRERLESQATKKGFKTITEYLKALIENDLKSPD